MRRLSVTRRQVPLDRVDEYRADWETVVAAAGALDANAWLFRGATHEDRFLEFLEWGEAAAAPLLDDTVLAALDQLESYGTAARGDEWEEVT